jgi:uncharacterized protein YdeI (BOF family)
MKKRFVAVAALGMALGTFTWGTAANAGRVSDSSTRRMRSAHPAQVDAGEGAELKIFTGTITKDGEQFVLRDDTTKSSFQLDDQETAGKFANKRVRVMGVLDARNETIRVKAIEEAAA